MESVRSVLGDDIGPELLGIISALFHGRRIIIATEEGEVTLEKHRCTDQANPISPMIFALVMEFAGRLVVMKKKSNADTNSMEAQTRKTQTASLQTIT